jgi:hypothetical protein
MIASQTAWVWRSKEFSVAPRVASALWAGMMTETPDVRACSEGEATSAPKMASLSVFLIFLAAFKAGRTNGTCPKFIPALRTDQRNLRVIDHSAVSRLTKESASGEGPVDQQPSSFPRLLRKLRITGFVYFPQGSHPGAAQVRLTRYFQDNQRSGREGVRKLSQLVRNRGSDQRTSIGNHSSFQCRGSHCS